MADATGDAKPPSLWVTFDRRLKLEFHGARITSDGGLFAYRELDDVFGLTTMGVSALAEGWCGTSIRHQLVGLLRRAVYGRLAGYEDINDAARLARDPAMRAIVGREGLGSACAASGRQTEPSRNAVHFMIRMAAAKSIRVVGCGVRGRSL